MAWLRTHSASISTLRAVALLFRAIRAASPVSGDGPPCLSAEASLPVILLLEPNMESESRLLRLSTLRVLARYDPLRFGKGDGGAGEGEEACNFLEVAEALEALPISIATERDLMWRLGQLEVLGRSGRLPCPYARLMAKHAFGLLRVKFSGVWPRAAAIIVALCQRRHQRDLVWEPMHQALRNVMPPPATRQQVVASSPWAQKEDARITQGSGGENVDAKMENGTDVAGRKPRGNGDDDGGTGMECEKYAPLTSSRRQQQQPSGLRAKVPPPNPWAFRLLTHAALLDAGPTEEMDLPVALQGMFLDATVRMGLQPESGEVPLWASTDADEAFAQVQVRGSVSFLCAYLLL